MFCMLKKKNIYIYIYIIPSFLDLTYILVLGLVRLNFYYFLELSKILKKNAMPCHAKNLNQ